MEQNAKEEKMQQRRTDDVRGVAAGYCDRLGDGVYGRPPSGCGASGCLRCCLDAGEGGLLLFAVALDGQSYEAVDELFVGEAGGLP